MAWTPLKHNGLSHSPKGGQHQKEFIDFVRRPSLRGKK
jgi:hypothetical protein